MLVLFFSLFTLAKENDVCVIKGSAATKRKGRSSWVKKTKRKSSVFSLYTSQNDIVSQQIRMRKIGAKTTPFQLFRGLTRGKHHFTKINWSFYLVMMSLLSVCEFDAVKRLTLSCDVQCCERQLLILQ